MIATSEQASRIRPRSRCRVGLLALIALALASSVAGPSRADTAPGLADFRSGRFAEALRSWQAEAASGDPTAALLVGIMFDTGEGVPRSYVDALTWYRRAADAGSPAGMFNVGVMYDAGRGVAQDRAEAARWYERAASAGFGRADYNLALMYESGDGVAPDRARAATLFEAAAARGVTAARRHLAKLGRPFTGAIAHGTEEVGLREFREAQQALLARGTGEAASAAELFRRAAMQHNALAEYDLGYCYENGIGVPQDKRRAYEWYTSAAADAGSLDVRQLADTGARAVAQQLTQRQNPTEP